MPRFAMESDISVLDNTDIIFIKKNRNTKIRKGFKFVMRLPSYSLYIYSQLLADSRYSMILEEHDRRNRDRRIPRIAVKKYNNSPFEYLYHSLNDQALLNATGHNHRTFDLLLKKFSPYYKYYTFEKGTDVIRKKIC